MASTNQPSATPNDCLLLFSSAISAQPGSITQRSTLTKLKDTLDRNPAFIPILYPSLLSLISTNANQQLYYRTWISSVIQMAISKTTLSADQRLQIVLQSTETIHRLITLQDPSDHQLIQTKKMAIQAFSSAYPILFKHTCTKSTTTNDSKQWGLSNQIKGTILSLWRNENSSLGIRLAANKFVQRVIQVGTRGLIDPRKRNEDPSIVMCGSSSSAQQHPYLKPKELEQEANNLLEESTRIMFQSKIPELVAAIVISLGSLVRLRPSLSPIIMTALASYNPSTSPLVSRTISVLQLKGIEKTLRITLSHLDRNTPASPYTQQIREALVNQTKRIEELNEKERERKRQRKEEEMCAKKRARVTQRPEIQEINPPPVQMIHPTIISTNQLPGFDVTSLPVELVAELVIANLQVLSDQALNNAINVYLSSMHGERSNVLNEPPSIGQTQSNLSQPPHPTAVTQPLDHPHFIPPGSPVRPKMEIDSPSSKIDTESSHQQLIESSNLNKSEDTLENDVAMDDEELVLQPNPDLEEGETEAGDKLIFPEAWQTDAPTELSELSRRLMIRMTLDRIVSNGLIADGSKVQSGVWSMLLSRLVTRGMSGSGDSTVEEIEMRKEDIRQSLFQFVIADFSNRVHFARAWLMEEWLAKPTDPNQFDHPTDLISATPYERWLTMTLDYIVNNVPPSNPVQSDSTRPVLSAFLLDLPYVSERELMRLQQMCQDPNKLTVGFTTLRDLTATRPTLRNRTLDVLLGLSTHSRRQTRTAAIMSVKSWVSPNNQMNNLGERVVSFAVQLLQKLEKGEEEVEAEGNENKMLAAEAKAGTIKNEANDRQQEVEMEDGETTEWEAARQSTPEPPITFAKVQNAVILSGLGKVKTEDVVVQHLELLLALSAKNPDLLDHLFRSYPLMPGQVQESVNELITPLVRTLGGKHPKIVSLIQNCLSGSESLVLRILSILTEKGKPPAGIIEAVKNLASKSSDLSPRFIIPMIGELTKSEIIHHLPRILTLLNGKPDEKNLVRSVFDLIIQQPPTNFGSVSTNAPRVKQSELLTPVELLVLIHRTEDAQYSIKQAIEAIGLCFSMTEVFKPEVLAAFMQQVVDELTLPTLFLRTVIQAVQTYKSLQAFVSTTLLSRLILKKIWTQPQLWEGFMRCAKIIAPHSFGAILQLPRDQLKELVGKQAGLKAPLRDYVNKKAGNNKGRVTSLLEILSDTNPNSPKQPPAADAIPMTPTGVTSMGGTPPGSAGFGSMSTASGFATGGMVDGAPGTHLPLGPIHLGSLGDDRGLFPDLARHHADIVGPHALPLRPPHTLPLNPSGLPPSVGHDRLRMVPAEPSPSVDGIPMVDGPPNPHSQNSTTTPTNNSNPQNNENNHANNNGNNNSGGGNSSDPTLLIPAAVG
ncbi:hypothetical protein PtA15_2A38 [Puccinia triticina]|uniref:Symplekin n=1 Tax=Puccinia triticina TaxID=208348 RepID=A0ABY7CB86_9BASI|nr:uncharacterized protein PtA15_2A38 [Puccinia triticina]WAQ81727.1 hypothetical protein PtA15_2A38 [Puccinia triticina]WAR52614.1 hypothetical protein PtB15_2B38 [Puccinia triticina]